MAYYNQITIASGIGEAGVPVAALSPLYEATTPQYQIPTPYTMAQIGYMRNEVLFACVQKRMQSVSEPPMALYKGDNDKPVKSHALMDLLARPNEAMGEVEFWQATQCYLDIAGVSVWEKEYNRIGEVINLWPMRPDWCSFRRGATRPLEFVRYQPWGGIPFVDVPVERCLIFMEFNPVWPNLKPLSRSAVAMRALGVDNAATDFLRLFFEHGAQSNGIIKTKQSLQSAEAKRIKDLWREQHGGAANWQDVTVLGSDIDYIPTQMNFKDMGFENIDGRDESRICQCFDMQPVLIGSRIGLNRAIDNNYEMALKQFTEGPLSARWRWLESEVSQQLLPDFEGPDSAFSARFDTKRVRALQEDWIKKWTICIEAGKSNLAYRDELRRKMDLDPVDGGEQVFVGVAAAPIEAPPSSAMVFDPSLDAATLKAEAEQAKADQAQQQADALAKLNGQPAQDGQTVVPGSSTGKEPAPSAPEQFNGMVKSYAAARKLALSSVGQPVGMPFDAELSECKTAGEVRAVFEKHWPKARQVKTADEVAALLERALAAADKLV